MNQDDIDRFWSRVVVDCACDCWVWVGARSSGYGRFGIGGKTEAAYRVAYSQWRGQIAAGLEIDHLCRNRACVNPWHMEVVSKKENCLRGNSPPAKNARKASCAQGHPIRGSEADVYLYGGRIFCAKCRRAREKLRYRARKDPVCPRWI